MRRLVERCLLVCFLGSTPVVTVAQSIGITGTVPASPVAGEPLVLHLTIPTPSSGNTVLRHVASVLGNVIHVDGCYGGSGFAVAGTYTAAVGLPAMQAGTYSVEYYQRYASSDAQCDLASSNYIATFAFNLPARTASYPPPAGPVARVAQYFNVNTGFYFITASEQEQVAIESGHFVGWQPVNIAPSSPNTYGFFDDTSPGRAAVCRFFSAAFAPKSSHFFSANPAECEAVKNNPLWTFEGDVGYVAVANATGSCPSGSVPLYRMYNNGVGGAPTHIYTTSESWYVGLSGGGGWAAEGILGCVVPW
jgi:hypothetical protein